MAVGTSRLRAHSRALAVTISLSVATVWLILGIMATEYFMADPRSAKASELNLAIALLAALLSIVLGFRRKLKALVFTSAFAVAIAVEIAGFCLLPNLDPSLSARERGTLLRESAQSDFYTYHLQRSWDYGLAFYAGREIKEWSPENAGAASLLTTAQGLSELKRLGRFSGVVNPSERGIRYVRIETAAR